jgi:hypothetical protein
MNEPYESDARKWEWPRCTGQNGETAKQRRGATLLSQNLLGRVPTTPIFVLRNVVSGDLQLRLRRAAVERLDGSADCTDPLGFPIEHVHRCGRRAFAMPGIP